MAYLAGGSKNQKRKHRLRDDKKRIVSGKTVLHGPRDNVKHGTEKR